MMNESQTKRGCIDQAFSSVGPSINSVTSSETRRIWHEDEWFYSVADVCGILTQSPDAGEYWRKLKQRLKKEGSEVMTMCHGLKLKASDQKRRGEFAFYIGTTDPQVEMLITTNEWMRGDRHV